MTKKRALQFPLFVELILIAAFAIMAGIEYLHESWFWFALFALATAFFGISVLDRALKGVKNAPRP